MVVRVSNSPLVSETFGQLGMLKNNVYKSKTINEIELGKPTWKGVYLILSKYAFTPTKQGWGVKYHNIWTPLLLPQLSTI